MKVLLTGGCSFSECISTHISTWPRHLANYYSNYQHISTGMGSQGNGLISRKIIYQLIELLKTTSPEDILVGIMWSGPDRHDFYIGDKTVNTNKSVDGYMENPTSVNPKSRWLILNHHWQETSSKMHYAYFHNFVGGAIYTMEHILRTQWFLKNNNIKYFMSTYTKEVFRYRDHSDVKYLYDQIDFTKFLPIDGEYEWCRDFSGIEFPVKGDSHPGSNQHQLFTERVIVPFLKEHYGII